MLYVDNDIASLVVFESSVEGWLPFRTATNGAEALEILSSHEIGVLLADRQACTGPGLDLLELARKEHPDTIRVMLAPPSEVDRAVEFVDRGTVHHFLCKPWDALELRLSLDSAMERYKTTRRLRELESRLLSTERVYALGKVAAEIAHEIRNPLGALVSNLQIAESRLNEVRRELEAQSDPRLLAKLHDLERILADCAEATDSILEITRSVESTTRSSCEAVWVDLEEVVRTSLRSLQKNAGHQLIEVITTKVPPVRGSRTQLAQVVTNLVVNAIEATRAVEGDDPRLSVRVWHEGGRVFLEVKDRGPGIEPEHLDRLFEPFFTTKTEGGTGLGLAITRRIVERHGGKISVESQPQMGASFVVELPAAVES